MTKLLIIAILVALSPSHNEPKAVIEPPPLAWLNQPEISQAEPIAVPDIQPQATVQPMPTPAVSQTPATSPQTASESGWHYNCVPQAAAVQSAVESLGLASQWIYINYIFGHESCNDPGRLNAGGCRGLGQACPGSKLPCGASDIACQVQYFTSYANGRYGSWALAYAYWLGHQLW